MLTSGTFGRGFDSRHLHQFLLSSHSLSTLMEPSGRYQLTDSMLMLGCTLDTCPAWA